MSDQWARVLRLWGEAGRAGSPWRPGMRYRSLSGPGWSRLCGGDPSAWLLTERPPIDLTDPATLGTLTGLLREVWGDPRAYACGPTEGEALLAGIIAGLEREVSRG